MQLQLTAVDFKLKRRMNICGETEKYRYCPPQYLEIAKSNLEKFQFFGITEKFDETLALCQKNLNWKYVYNVTKNRNNKKLNLVNQEIISCIEKYNQLDLELYSYALKKFNKMVDEANIIPQLKELKRTSNVSISLNESKFFCRRLFHRIKRELIKIKGSEDFFV